MAAAAPSPPAAAERRPWRSPVRRSPRVRPSRRPGSCRRPRARGSTPDPTTRGAASPIRCEEPATDRGPAAPEAARRRRCRPAPPSSPRQAPHARPRTSPRPCSRASADAVRETRCARVWTRRAPREAAERQSAETSAGTSTTPCARDLQAGDGAWRNRGLGRAQRRAIESLARNAVPRPGRPPLRRGPRRRRRRRRHRWIPCAHRERSGPRRGAPARERRTARGCGRPAPAAPGRGVLPKTARASLRRPGWRHRPPAVGR